MDSGQAGLGSREPWEEFGESLGNEISSTGCPQKSGHPVESLLFCRVMFSRLYFHFHNVIMLKRQIEVSWRFIFTICSSSNNKLMCPYILFQKFKYSISSPSIQGVVDNNHQQLLSRESNYQFEDENVVDTWHNIWVRRKKSGGWSIRRLALYHSIRRNEEQSSVQWADSNVLSRHYYHFITLSLARWGPGEGLGEGPGHQIQVGADRVLTEWSIDQYTGLWLV